LAVQNLKSIEAGDVFIKGGTPGHAVTVMDVAMNAKGEKIFLLSQSYMPAQDIHILKNFNDLSISPWYRVSDIESTLETPEYTFEPLRLNAICRIIHFYESHSMALSHRIFALSSSEIDIVSTNSPGRCSPSGKG
jgi:hypothetical protein